MPFPRLGRTSRKAQRLTEIAIVLARHGFTYFVHRLNLHRYLPRRSKWASRAGPIPERVDEETLARRVALVMEDLGPTFVKLGQVLSTRPDLVPEAFVREFRRFQDHVVPFDSEKAIAVVEHELGGRVGELFEWFGEQPVASGSLAQVHPATLKSGQAVVVKVQRPGINRIVMTDVDILLDLARYAERHVTELRIFRPVLIMEEFQRSMRRELEFVTEASYTAKFHEAFSDGSIVRTPKVFWEFTTSQVLTMERLEGVNIGQRDELVRRGIDCHQVACRLVEAFMRMFFEIGLFHADPHPGNLLVADDGTLSIVDFGNTGHLSDELRRQTASLLIALSRREDELVVRQLCDIGLFPPGTDSSAIERDILELLDRYYGIPLKRLDTRSVFADLTRIMRENNVLLPREFLLVARALMLITSTAREIDPDFNVADVLAPYAHRLLIKKLSPRGVLRELATSTYGVAHLLHRLPGQVADIIRKMDAGTWQILFKHEGLENFIHELDRVSNRISVSIILGAVVIGSSLILHAGLWPTIGRDPGISILGLLGYIIAGLMGLWLVWDILRSGRY